jgi:pilus assembly protein Flp/PilA
MFSAWLRAFQQEDGHGAVEYAVMLALIVVTCLAVVRTVGVHAESTFDTIRSILL